jgi:rhodanese-related sulfurtransferase
LKQVGTDGDKHGRVRLIFKPDFGNWVETIQEAVILSVVAICLALAVNALSPVGIPLLCPGDEPVGAVDSRFSIVSVTEARRLHDAGGVVFVDSRSADQYEAGHIPGACSLPLYQLDDALLPFLSAVQPDAAIIVYCSSVTCEDSHMLARELSNMGYENIRIFAGGMAAWREKGFAVAVQ